MTLSDGERYTVVLMDDDGYTLADDPSRQAQFIWGFKECLGEQGPLNPTLTNAGGWGATSLRSWLNGDFLDSLPEWLKNATPRTEVWSEKDAATAASTSDRLFIPAEREVFDSSTVGVTVSATHVHQWQWYKTPSNRIKDGHKWKTRTLHRSNPNEFTAVETDGAATGSRASIPRYICPHGCMGSRKLSEPVDFAKATDAEMEAWFAAGNPAPATWKVGDEREVTLSDGENHTVVLVDVDPIGYTMSSGGPAKFVWGFEDTLGDLFTASGSGGYGSWNIGSYLDGTVRQMLPGWLRSATRKASFEADDGTSGGTRTVSAFLFVPSATEVWGPDAAGSAACAGLERQFGWYKAQDHRVKQSAGVPNGGKGTGWWTRTSSSATALIRGSSANSGCVPKPAESGAAWGICPHGCL